MICNLFLRDLRRVMKTVEYVRAVDSNLPLRWVTIIILYVRRVAAVRRVDLSVWADKLENPRGRGGL